MKRKGFFLVVTFLFIIVSTGIGQDFPNWFEDKTMRIDIFFTGTNSEEIISLDEIIEEPFWAGSITNLVDTFNLGQHQVQVYDEETGKLLYSRGFSSIFGEWQTTEEAASGIYRTFSASLRIPYPKKEVRVTVSTRNEKNEFVEKFSTIIDPKSRFVKHDKPLKKFKPRAFIKNGSPHEKVDILILPEGYTKREFKTFKRDMKRLVNVLFSTYPFSEHRDKFNLWYIKVCSEESGIDDPREGKFVNSFFNVSYNSLDMDRYIL